jgi:hypothetical protein
MTSKPITERLTSLGQYAMNCRPDTWPGPDAVDAIQAQEAWEQTDDYELAALDWGTNDADIVAEIKDRFYGTVDYDKAFQRWVDGQAP